MRSKDIFSALAKYNSATDENYLTEALVFVVKSLFSRERLLGIELLDYLCVKNNEFSFGEDERVAISTQEVTEQGTPDIKISTSDKLIYIEVKHDSPLGYRQVERYKKVLESSPKTIKHVVLLTRFAIDFEGEEERPYKHIRWFEVYNWLDNIKSEGQIVVYLIESFKSFLEVKRMSMQKVGWEYINGVPAFNNLIDMLGEAIKGASLQVHQRSAGWASKAFWLENKKFWCGIYYNNPLVVVFKAFNKKDLDVGKVKPTSYPVKKALKSIWFQLQLEDNHFFSLDKDKQLEELTKFVKTAYSEAQQMRPKKKASPPQQERG